MAWMWASYIEHLHKVIVLNIKREGRDIYKLARSMFSIYTYRKQGSALSGFSLGNQHLAKNMFSSLFSSMEFKKSVFSLNKCATMPVTR